MAATTEGITFKHAEKTHLEIRVCPSCGITYALPERVVEDRREKGGSWYCPNGHSIGFTKNEKANAAWWRNRADSERKETEHARAQANGYKGAARRPTGSRRGSHEGQEARGERRLPVLQPVVR